MPYTDILELKGILANACLHHGVFSDYETPLDLHWGNPYCASAALIPDIQGPRDRVQAYIKAVESLRALWQSVSLTKIESGLGRLEETVASQNETAFTQALAEIDWNNRPAEDYIRAIDLALQVGAHLAARKLATEGAEFHFDSEELQKYARVLAPPKPLARRDKSDVQPKANIAWLNANKERYKGQWVAIKNGVFVASAPTYKALIAELGDFKGRGILLTPIY